VYGKYFSKVKNSSQMRVAGNIRGWSGMLVNPIQSIQMGAVKPQKIPFRTQIQ